MKAAKKKSTKREPGSSKAKSAKSKSATKKSAVKKSAVKKTAAKKTSAKKSSAKKTGKKTAAKKSTQKHDKKPFRSGLKAFFHPDKSEQNLGPGTSESPDMRAESVAMQQQSRDSEDERKAYQLARAPLERRHAHDGSRARRSQGAQIKK